ncbi:MAG: hypothetical protein ACXAC2_12015 [Candidatus Kariarchaeaceae archaeon]
MPVVNDDFIVSNYYYEKEMARDFEYHEAGDVVVIPVVIRSIV